MTLYAIRCTNGSFVRRGFVLAFVDLPAATLFNSMTAALLFQETHQVEGEVIPVRRQSFHTYEEEPTRG